MDVTQITDTGSQDPIADSSSFTDPTATDNKPGPVTPKQIEDLMAARIEQTKMYRRQRSASWKTNVDLRIGEVATVFTGGIDINGSDVKTSVNPDWALTKTKTANLFSQVPAVKLTHETDPMIPAIAPFNKALNYELSAKRAHAAAPMEEVLNDVVNASGIGFVYVDYTARFETKLVPAQDPMAANVGQPAPAPQDPSLAGPADAMAGAMPPQQPAPMVPQAPPPMVPAQRVVSDKFGIHRLSPTDGLWPMEFVGSDFNDADFVGYTGRMTWADAKNEWPVLTDLDKEQVLNQQEYKVQDDLRENPARSVQLIQPKVLFDRVFYWRARVDPDEKQLNCIWEIVYVHGKTTPVAHGPWKGQQVEPQSGKLIGSLKFPVQVLTLTYITDNPVPPSDTEAGRPQVNDLRRSRTQMFLNRERSQPLRWYDVNRVDPEVANTIMRGTWQNIVPSNGAGDRSFGEVARAAYPSEDFTFDERTEADLYKTWMIGPNQMGNSGSGEETATVGQITQNNFQTRMGQERNRVATFFTNICEVLSGLMVLYSDFPMLTPEERQQMMNTWNNKLVPHDFVFKILPDSQIVQDSNARMMKLQNFLNMTVKSGYVDPMPILIEMAELAGLDPTKVVKPPTPKDDDKPQISMRFSGAADLQNVAVAATLDKHGELPSPENVSNAAKFLKAAQDAAIQQQGNGAVPLPGLAPEAPPSGPAGPPPPAGPGGGPTAPVPQNGHPNWQLGDRVMKRSRDIGGE